MLATTESKGLYFCTKIACKMLWKLTPVGIASAEKDFKIRNIDNITIRAVKNQRNFSCL
jgi:hypothetical protein